jgi:hypothetical protein
MVQISPTNIASTNKFADEGVVTSYIASLTLPAWLLPSLIKQEIETYSRPDAIIALRIHTTHTSVIEQLKCI